MYHFASETRLKINEFGSLIKIIFKKQKIVLSCILKSMFEQTSKDIEMQY